jgi:hypothetical protein
MCLCARKADLSITREINVIYQTLQQNLLCHAHTKKRVLQCSNI